MGTFTWPTNHSPQRARRRQTARALGKDPNFDYEIETIRFHRQTEKGMEYLVKWTGFLDSDNLWVAEKALGNARETLLEYLKRQIGVVEGNGR